MPEETDRSVGGSTGSAPIWAVQLAAGEAAEERGGDLATERRVGVPMMVDDGLPVVGKRRDHMGDRRPGMWKTTMPALGRWWRRRGHGLQHGCGGGSVDHGREVVGICGEAGEDGGGKAREEQSLVGFGRGNGAMEDGGGFSVGEDEGGVVECGKGLPGCFGGDWLQGWRSSPMAWPVSSYRGGDGSDSDRGRMPGGGVVRAIGSMIGRGRGFDSIGEGFGVGKTVEKMGCSVVGLGFLERRKKVSGFLL